MTSEGAIPESSFGGDLRLEADPTAPLPSENSIPGDIWKSRKITKQLRCEGHSRGRPDNASGLEVTHKTVGYRNTLTAARTLMIQPVSERATSMSDPMKSQETTKLCKSLYFGVPYKEKTTNTMVPRAPSESALRDNVSGSV